MNTYKISFRGVYPSGSVYPDAIVKADHYGTEDSFVHFWIESESESIASFQADSILSIVKDSSTTPGVKSHSGIGGHEEDQLPSGLQLSR